MTRLRSRHLPWATLFAVPVAFSWSSVASANAAGVSDERVVLPDGPGSIGGIGENVEAGGQMGLMTLSVPFEVPQGHQHATPELGLNYSSGAGSGVVGIGWGVSMPAIERTTFRGLPEYDENDVFAFDGSEELVEVGEDDGVAVYRARFERGMVRYKWHERGDGTGGYWTAEFPDGRVGYFGADAEGTSVANARVTHPDGGVFRYHLVELVDPFGHSIVYSYVKSQGTALVDAIEYAFGADGPRFSIRFVYEDREDVLSDGKPGFDLRLDQRLTEVRFLSGAEVIRRYSLAYESYSEAGGFSRLARVTERGRADEVHPIEFTFGYSRALGGACTEDCERPFVVEMGTLSGGVDISTGRATLIDINGDSLPDVLSSNTDGKHTFHLSELSTEGRPSFSGDAVDSAMTASSSPFLLGAPGVQVLDVNGDGFTDIVASRTPDVLCNDGSGDWSGKDCIEDATLPVLEADDPGEADPLHVRFLDYDNDKRIDMIRTTAGQTEVFRNDGTAFSPVLVDDIGVLFDESTLQLADMNGDGLQDPVELLGGSGLRYRKNLGHGRWSDWIEIALDGFDTTQLLSAELQDINGDSLADVVVVLGTELQYALNRNGEHFEAVVTVGAGDVEGDLPERTSSTTVVFADMNGNGTDDVVWITSAGDVRFLEMFPVKPNLLSRIENGIGSVQEVSYGTSVAELARDAADAPWSHRLTHAMNVVKRVDSWVKLTGDDGGMGLHEVTEYDYHDGFYDGVEKQFRGFARVERRLLADMEQDSQEPGTTLYEYDVGAQDAYRNGLLLSQRDLGGPEGTTPLRETQFEYGDCPVAEVDNDVTARDVRYLCELSREELVQEGATESAWASVRSESEYDGYGNVTRASRLGVAHMGTADSPEECAPCTGAAGAFGAACGADCLGDEEYVVTEYVTPGADTGGRWILGAPFREIEYGVDGGPQRETLTFYDGPDFVGAPAGTLERGAVTRVLERSGDGADDFVAAERHAYDANGNVVASLDPLGDPDDTSGHRREYTYDPSGLALTRVEVLLSDADGEYRLRRDLVYEDVFYVVSEATGWMVVRGDQVVTPRQTERFRYDAFGRIRMQLLAGDADTAPTREYVYDLGDPVTRVITRARSRVGGEVDMEEVRCLDGRGRVYQTRAKLDDDSYYVDGFVQFNRRGEPVREYQGYESDSDACDTAPPDAVLFSAFKYDAFGRQVEMTLPDGDLYDTPSVRRTVYEPLGTVVYDEEDSDPESGHADTPERHRRDGLGRLVAVERFLDASGAPTALRMEYDSLGRLAAWEDAAGNRHTQLYDLRDRVVLVDDPNSGMTAYEYDDADNVVLRTEANGVSTVTTYDGANRPLEAFDPDDREQTLVSRRYDLLESCRECSNPAGKLVEATFALGLDDASGEGVDRYGYDARNQAVHVSRTLEGHEFVTRHEYDNAGRLTRTTYPDGQKLERRYDGASRLVSVPGVVDRFTYDARGLPATIEHANGVEERMGYDDVERMASLDIRRDGSVLQGYAFERDRVGNLLAVTDTGDEREGRPGLGQTLKYDAWYRLTGVTFDPEASGAEVLTYAYDDIDNVLSAVSSRGAASPAHVGDYVYDSARPNAVAEAGGREMDYDEGGRMIDRDGLELTWDHDDDLERATRDGEVVGQFAYGPDDERVMKLEGGGAIYYVGPDFEVRDGIGVLYPRDGERRLARLETDALATELLSDLGPDGGDERISAADAWLAHAAAEDILEVDGDASPPGRLLRASARRMLFEDGPRRAHLQHDALGSIVLATDAEGEILGERTYYPTGETRSESGHVDSYGFTGQERDESTGLLHFSARYLDPHIGRWTTTDPAFTIATPDEMDDVADATTGYAYVANNFANTVDPTGLKGEKVGKPYRRGDIKRGIFKSIGKGFKKAGKWTWSKFKSAGRWAKGKAKAGWAKTKGAFNYLKREGKWKGVAVKDAVRDGIAKAKADKVGTTLKAAGFVASLTSLGLNAAMLFGDVDDDTKDDLKIAAKVSSGVSTGTSIAGGVRDMYKAYKAGPARRNAQAHSLAHRTPALRNQAAAPRARRNSL